MGAFVTILEVQVPTVVLAFLGYILGKFNPLFQGFY